MVESYPDIAGEGDFDSDYEFHPFNPDTAVVSKALGDISTGYHGLDQPPVVPGEISEANMPTTPGDDNRREAEEA